MRFEDRLLVRYGTGGDVLVRVPVLGAAAGDQDDGGERPGTLRQRQRAGQGEVPAGVADVLGAVGQRRLRVLRPGGWRQGAALEAERERLPGLRVVTGDARRALGDGPVERCAARQVGTTALNRAPSTRTSASGRPVDPCAATSIVPTPSALSTRPMTSGAPGTSMRPCQSPVRSGPPVAARVPAHPELNSATPSRTRTAATGPARPPRPGGRGARALVTAAGGTVRSTSGFHQLVRGWAPEDQASSTAGRAAGPGERGWLTACRGPRRSGAGIRGPRSSSDWVERRTHRAPCRHGTLNLASR